MKNVKRTIAAVIAAVAIVMTCAGMASAAPTVHHVAGRSAVAPSCPAGSTSTTLRRPNLTVTTDQFTTVFSEVPGVYQRVDTQANAGYVLVQLSALVNHNDWVTTTPTTQSEPTAIITDGNLSRLKVCWQPVTP